ncbi:MAG: spore germination protein [Bacillota bacterium]|nr:spore germination protein [Bacillota bacterium]
MGYLFKKIRLAKLLNENRKNVDLDDEREQKLISKDLGENIKDLRSVIDSGGDIVLREFCIGNDNKPNAAVVFIEGLVNKDILDASVLKPLMFLSALPDKSKSGLHDIDFIENNLLSAGNISRFSAYDELIDNLFSGEIILLVGGASEGLVINAFDPKTRAVEPPMTESVVRGSREGFTESIRTNISLLRRKIKNPDLCFEKIKIGKKSKTDVAVAYLKSIADPALIEEIKKRLGEISIDAVLESGYIEQFIEDAPFSIFPTVANSEKPDKVAAKLLEGRAAIFVDGTPFVLTVPMLFIESFQRSEDYYARPYYASMIRLIRFACYFISVLAPAVYIALTTFHQELIPTKLLLTLAAGHEQIPFPSVIEAFFILTVFEILREAGITMPQPVGSAVSIVGALVLGESAVTAGLIGPFMVIIVALTAISGFVVTAQIDSATVLRFVFLILAGAAGGFGIIMGMLVVGIHLASLRSFGIPYLSPISPFMPAEQKDALIRAPLRTFIFRPTSIVKKNITRQNPGALRKNNEKNPGGQNEN